MLEAYEHHLRRALENALSRGERLDLDIFAELASDRDEIERRIKAAEEQAAAAWDRVGKLEKVVEELRQGTAETFRQTTDTIAALGRMVVLLENRWP